MDIRSIIKSSLTESTLPYDENVDYIMSKISARLHPNSDDASHLRNVADLAHELYKVQTGAAGGDYRTSEAAANLKNYLVRWHTSQRQRENSRLNGMSLDTTKVARETSRPWWESGESGDYIDYDMTRVQLLDAADHLDLATHVVNKDREGFRKKARSMDTQPRDEIPDRVWRFHFGD